MTTTDFTKTPGYYAGPPPITFAQARGAALTLAQVAPDAESLAIVLDSLDLTDWFKEPRP